MKIRRVISIGLASAALLGFAACGSDDDSSDGTTATSVVDEVDVAGVTWTLVTLAGDAPPAGVEATLLFDGSSVSGSSGCNQYSGEATFDEDVVAISEGLAGTMMACEPEVSEFEAAYLAMLAEAQLFYVEGDTLTFTTDGGDALAEFAAG